MLQNSKSGTKSGAESTVDTKTALAQLQASLEHFFNVSELAKLAGDKHLPSRSYKADLRCKDAQERADAAFCILALERQLTRHDSAMVNDSLTTLCSYICSLALQGESGDLALKLSQANNGFRKEIIQCGMSVARKVCEIWGSRQKSEPSQRHSSSSDAKNYADSSSRLLAECGLPSHRTFMAKAQTPVFNPAILGVTIDHLSWDRQQMQLVNVFKQQNVSTILDLMNLKAATLKEMLGEGAVNLDELKGILAGATFCNQNYGEALKLLVSKVKSPFLKIPRDTVGALMKQVVFNSVLTQGEIKQLGVEINPLYRSPLNIDNVFRVWMNWDAVKDFDFGQRNQQGRSKLTDLMWRAGLIDHLGQRFVLRNHAEASDRKAKSG